MNLSPENEGKTATLHIFVQSWTKKVTLVDIPTHIIVEK